MWLGSPLHNIELRSIPGVSHTFPRTHHCCTTQEQTSRMMQPVQIRTLDRSAGRAHLTKGITFSNCFCQCTLNSCPAAFTHASTASARLGRMSCILSSAFGDFCSNWSIASTSTDAGEVEPIRKIDSVASGSRRLAAQLLGSILGDAYLELFAKTHNTQL